MEIELIDPLLKRGREKQRHLSELKGMLNRLTVLRVGRDIVNGSLPDDVVEAIGEDRIAELRELFLPQKGELERAYDSLAREVVSKLNEEPELHPPKSPQAWQPSEEYGFSQSRLRKQVAARVLRRAQRVSGWHRQRVDLGLDERDRLDEQLAAIDKRMPVVNLQESLLVGVSGIVENLAGIARSNVLGEVAQDLKEQAEAIHTKSSGQRGVLSAQRDEVNGLIDRAIDRYWHEQSQVDQMTRVGGDPLGMIRETYLIDNITGKRTLTSKHISGVQVDLRNHK